MVIKLLALFGSWSMDYGSSLSMCIVNLIACLCWLRYNKFWSGLLVGELSYSYAVYVWYVVFFTRLAPLLTSLCDLYSGT